MASNSSPIELQKYLKGVDYPATRDDLVSTAKDNGAPDDLVKLLQGSERDSFDSPAAVSSAVGGAD